MNKNNKNINSNQNHGDHCQHVQIGGQAYYDDRKYFLFSPDAPVPQAVESFRKAGVGQQMSDGTFDFVVRPKVKSRSVLIRKLAHGRISRTQDNAVQLTLKFFRTENVIIAQAIMEDPEILILDEPFNGLDKQGQADIHALLQSLKAEGKTILLASHSAADIEKACDAVYTFSRGKVVKMA